MIIGVPKEIKNNENRVGLVPGGVRQLIHDGHEVYVETNAGVGIGINDEQFIQAGAKILPTLEEVFEKSTMIFRNVHKLIYSEELATRKFREINYEQRR